MSTTLLKEFQESLRKPAGRLQGPAFRDQVPFRTGEVIFEPDGGWFPRDEFQPWVLKLLDSYLVTGAVREKLWFDDNAYYLPTVAEIRAVLNDWSLPKPFDVPNVFDCEDYAYLAKAQFAIHRLHDKTRTAPSAFACAIAWGENLATGGGRHALNVLFAKEGPQLVDKMPGHIELQPLPLPRPCGSQTSIHHLVV